MPRSPSQRLSMFHFLHKTATNVSRKQEPYCSFVSFYCKFYIVFYCFWHFDCPLFFPLFFVPIVSLTLKWRRSVPCWRHVSVVTRVLCDVSWLCCCLVSWHCCHHRSLHLVFVISSSGWVMQRLRVATLILVGTLILYVECFEMFHWVTSSYISIEAPVLSYKGSYGATCYITLHWKCSHQSLISFWNFSVILFLGY